MRTTAPLLPCRSAGPLPTRLPTIEAALVVRDALARRPHGRAVVVFADGEVRVEDREELVATYRRAGVRPLASQLERALVPAHRVLGLVDLEVGTRVVLLDPAELLALAVDDVPACAAFAAVRPVVADDSSNTAMADEEGRR